jgi:hypothetical protein
VHGRLFAQFLEEWVRGRVAVGTHADVESLLRISDALFEFFDGCRLPHVTAPHCQFGARSTYTLVVANVHDVG